MTTVIPRHTPADGFRASVGKWITDQANDLYRGNPEMPNADRRYQSSVQLARFVTTLPTDDPRFRLLLRASTDSDYFSGTSTAVKFLTFCGLNEPAPADPGILFTEFACEATADIPPTVIDENAAMREKYQAERTKDQNRIAELESQAASLEREVAEQKRINSDLRGRVKEFERNASPKPRRVKRTKPKVAA